MYSSTGCWCVCGPKYRNEISNFWKKNNACVLLAILIGQLQYFCWRCFDVSRIKWKALFKQQHPQAKPTAHSLPSQRLWFRYVCEVQGRIQTIATDANASVRFWWGCIHYCLHQSDSSELLANFTVCTGQIASVRLRLGLITSCTYHYQLGTKVSHKQTSYWLQNASVRYKMHLSDFGSGSSPEVPLLNTISESVCEQGT